LTGDSSKDDQEALSTIAKKANIKIPAQISALFDKPVTQKTLINKQDIEKEILDFL
jgi:threonine synthase